MGNSPCYALYMRLGGPHTLSGNFQKDKKKISIIYYLYQKTHIYEILNYINYLFVLIYIN